MAEQFQYAVYTNVGGRETNEDSVGVVSRENKNCFVLCDGLGGHGMGDVASSLVVDVFKNQFDKEEDVSAFLEQSFLAAQDILLTAQEERNAKNKMKTTCVVVAMNDQNAHIGHVGDSRGYVFCRNKVKCRTMDHSIPQMLVLSKEIKESQIRNHPDRNLLLRVMGVEWDDAQYELMKPIKLKKCQAFLLCSDGFWELIEEKQMCALLKKASSAQEWLSSMVEIVRQNGKDHNMDNFSAIAIMKNNKKA